MSIKNININIKFDDEDVDPEHEALEVIEPVIVKPNPEHPKCKKCQLYLGCNSPFMEAEIPEGAKVLFVGEAPAELEDLQNNPFVGDSGKIIREAAGTLDVPVGFTNAVRCRPPDNATPTQRQINFCNEFLLQDIENSNAEIVVTLGNTALKAVTGYSGVEAWRGKPLEKSGKMILATYHPAALLYESDKEESIIQDSFFEDIEKLISLLYEETEEAASDGVEYKLITTVQEAKEMFAALVEAGKVAYDLEFISLQAYSEGNAILMASFAIPGKAYALPLFHKETPFKEEELLEIVELFEKFLSGPTAKIGHNIKIDCLLPLATLGVKVNNVVGDTMLISQTLDSRHKIHDLKQLAGKYVGMYGYDTSLQQYVKEHKEADYARGGNYGNIPIDILWPYAAKDAMATLLIEPVLLSKLDEKQLNLYHEMIIPEIDTFTRIETNGCKLDVEMLTNYRNIYESKNEELLAKLRSHRTVKALEEKLNENNKKKDTKWIQFNPNSPVQTRKILYDKEIGFGFKPRVKTKTGEDSTAADAIKYYNNPWLVVFREYKLYESALSKYLTKMEGWIGKDNRIRSNYNLIGTETARTSSSDPNLQNIPTPEKQPNTLLASHPIKNVFTNTWEGGCLMAVDYSGMELRVMAALSRSNLMMKIFKEHGDMHRMVAAKAYGLEESEVTKELRYRGKWVNWTMQYGGGWPTLMDLYGLSEKEAKNLESSWNALFPEVIEYNNECIAFTRKNGYAVSPLGRRRYLPHIKNSTDKQQGDAERAAANHPIQSAASDILIMAIIVIDNIMQAHKMKSLIINTVHDSILFDVYPGELEELHKLVVDVMENIHSYTIEFFPNIDLSWMDVPLVAECEVGTHYGSLKPYGEHSE